MLFFPIIKKTLLKKIKAANEQQQSFKLNLVFKNEFGISKKVFNRFKLYKRTKRKERNLIIIVKKKRIFEND